MSDGLTLRTVSSDQIDILDEAVANYALTILGREMVNNSIYAIAYTEIVAMLTGLQMLDLPRHCVRHDGVRLVIEYGRLTYAGRGKGYIPFRPKGETST